MLEFLNPNQLLTQILGLQRNAYPEDAGKNIVIRDNYMNEFSKSENSVRIIFDHVNMKILQVSDNVENVTGHSANDFCKPSLSFAFNFFTLDHYNFIYVWLKWALSLHSRLDETGRKQRLVNVKHAICGIKAKHKDGHVMRILYRHYVLEETENGLPIVAAITLDNLTHLIKPDTKFYWGRMECGSEKKQHHHFLSNDGKNKATDVFNEKEKEVIRLLAHGKESKEIGTLLFMSSHTVDNYRRKMITKAGLKDTTALIQICKMIGGIL